MGVSKYMKELQRMEEERLQRVEMMRPMLDDLKALKEDTVQLLNQIADNTLTMELLCTLLGVDEVMASCYGLSSGGGPYPMESLMNPDYKMVEDSYILTSMYRAFNIGLIERGYDVTDQRKRKQIFYRGTLDERWEVIKTYKEGREQDE